MIGLHPATLTAEKTKACIDAVFSALHEFPHATLIFTKSNADEQGRSIGKYFENFCNSHHNAYCFASLGSLNYLSVLRHVDCLIGNSSSGIIEAPYCQTPTINIGDRQLGRLQASSIINVGFQVHEIISAIKRAIDPQHLAVVKQHQGLFGNGGTVEAIMNVLTTIDVKSLRKKSFFDVEVNSEIT